jgi:hypothetical protein
MGHRLPQINTDFFICENLCLSVADLMILEETAVKWKTPTAAKQMLVKICWQLEKRENNDQQK